MSSSIVRFSEVSAAQRASYEQNGFVVLPAAFDPAPLCREVEGAFASGFRDTSSTNVSAEAEIRFRYLPMMSAVTPMSLELLDDFAGLAEQLIGAAVIPVRAKAVEYHGASSWHRDSELDLASIGFACYLDALTEATGALQVIPGSHRDGSPPDAAEGAAVAVETVPGDVIVFDEHVLHASRGGRLRRQWRVDYVAAPTSESASARLREYFAAMFSPDWDGGYDVERYPTYGDHWRRTCRPEVNTVLEAAGAYAEAAAEEFGARRRRGEDPV